MDDFGDGGAYPECHIAQYPLEMGRKNKVSRLRAMAAALSCRIDEDAPGCDGCLESRFVATYC